MLEENLKKSQYDRKTLYETYTDYIDPSSITISHYLSRKFQPGQEAYLHKIKYWVQAQNPINKPLVFKTSPGVGIKSILSRWYHATIEENKDRKYKILPIIHFASNGGNSSNYFYCLYRIVIKLRESLRIKQGVDLLEEKIRKYFAYWLDTCSTEIEKQQVLLSSNDIFSKIVVVIEGVDKFIDQETGKQANIAFWLPQIFPKNVRVICTVGQSSQSLQYFEKKTCQIETVFISQDLTQRLISSSLDVKTIMPQQLEQQLKNILKDTLSKINCKSEVYKFIRIFSDFFLVQVDAVKHKDISDFMKLVITKKCNLKLLSKIETVADLYDYIILIYGQSLPFKKRLSEILMYFCLSQKGITIKEIIQLTRFTEYQWGLFSTIFSPVLIKHDSIYSIKCSSFIQSVIRNDRTSKQNKEAHLIKYHQKIAESLENTPNSIRKLEQETYHLFVAKSYFKLKEIVSSIQNFLLMFNPNNKYELSRYWQKLEQKGFDPVIEYNKAIEGFSMHYHPSDENIFKIIVQISRFLKQFCDFETYQTPSFRHPLIEGNMTQLQKIGLLQQFTQLEIYVDNSFSQYDEPQSIPYSGIEEQINQVREKYFPKEKGDMKFSICEEGQKNQVKQTTIQFEKSNKKIKKKLNTPILTQIEQLNVDVPMNREKFRNFYLNSLQQFIQNDDYSQAKQEDGFFEVQDDNLINDSKKVNKNKVQISVNKIKESYRTRHIKPTLYYYKRWIWIQFPWVCISLNSNYSNSPQFSKHLSCEDLQSYQQQAKYTKQALIVAIEAKQKKKMMFTKKSDTFNWQNNGLGSRFKNSHFSGTKYTVGRNVDKSSMRSRVLQKTFTAVDLSLNTLTKQLQLRKKNLPTLNKNDSVVSQGVFLSQISQNCHQDMRFINERKHFQIPDTDGLPSNQILPKLKWSIKDHTNYEINYIKSHIEEKRKKLNKIIFENKKLAETYKELKLKQNLTKKSMNEMEADKNSRKAKLLEEYIKKKEEVINQFCKSLLQKERLKIILKLCAENKTRNEEYLASLNYFLQNLKKMITWQKNNIKELTNEMSSIKVMKQRKLMMEAEKEKNAAIVKTQMKNYIEEKEKLEQQIQNISVIIAEDLRDQKDKLENTIQGHLKNREEKNILLLQEKKTKQLEEKLKSLQQEYESLKRIFQIDGTDLEKSKKFKKLLQQNEKNKKLKILYFERKNKLQEIQKEYEKSKQKYELVKNKSKNEWKSTKDGRLCSLRDNKQAKQLQTQIKNTNNLKILLSNISLKLGVSKIEEIVPALKIKIAQFKVINPSSYQKLFGKSANNCQTI